MRFLRAVLSSLALCTLVLGGCASPGAAPTAPALPPIRAGTIARLMVDGPNAFINGRPVQGGSYVLDGDTVSTGSRTSAILVLNQGGQIQLDENTDPLFKQGACLLMKIFRGRVVFHNINCQEFEDGLKMAGVAHSYVHIMSSENESRVTVIAGEVAMRSPSQATLGRNAEYAATREGAVQVLQLTPEEANARTAWTRNYFQPGAAPAAGGVSPAAAAAVGVGVGVFLDYFGRHKHTSDQQEPKSTETQPQQTNPQPQKTNPQPQQTNPQLQQTNPLLQQTNPQPQPQP
jgi:hypothetical protein